MRVLLVNDRPPGPGGGAEVHVGRVADALTSVGCAVRLVCADRPHEGVRRALDLWDPGARRSVQAAVAEFGPEVIHLHNVVDELSTSVAGLGLPTVLTVHDRRLLGVRAGLDHERAPWRPDVIARSAKNRFARWRLRRTVDATIAPSRTLADELRRAGFPSVRHVENFAPAAQPAPLGTDVAFVGALHPHKGPQVLLDAWALVAAGHPTSELRVVGEGPLRASLEASAQRAGIADRVRFVGAVAPADVPDQLRRARLVVVPSLGAEGGGPTLAVVEAAAAGRPVVVTDRPGVAEGVDDTVGVVVPAGDVSALAAALDDLLSDPARLERLGGQAAARAAERWSPEAAAEHLLEIYRAVGR